MQLRRFILAREEIQDWSTYDEQSERALNAYSVIFNIRSVVGIAAICYLTFQYSGLHFITNVIPDALLTLSVGVTVVPVIIIVWRIATFRTIRPFLDFRYKIHDSLLHLLTVPLLASAAVWGGIILEYVILNYTGLNHYASLNPPFWSILLLLPALAVSLIFLLLCLYLPLAAFWARFAHPMLEPVTVMVTTCAVGIIQYLHPEKGAVPLRINHEIAICGMASTSILCILEFLTFCWLGLRIRKEAWAMYERQYLGPYSARRIHNRAYGGPGYRGMPRGHAANPIAAAVHYFPWRLPRRRGVRAAAAIAAVLVLLVLLVGRTSVGGTSGAAGGSASQSAQGMLTVIPNHDYVLAVGSPYPMARSAGADVGDLTGTAEGVEVWYAYALPLPQTVHGSYESCLNLDWKGPDVWTSQHVIPWSLLAPGRQICVQTASGSLWISLLTVDKAPADGQVTFKVTTWSCSARPDESTIC